MPRHKVATSTAGAIPKSGNGSAVAQSVTPPPAPVPVGAHDIFEKCIKRAENLLKIHSLAHGKKGKPEESLADTNRAAIVLAISALDAFIRSFVIARVISIVADKKKDIPPQL